MFKYQGDNWTYHPDVETRNEKEESSVEIQELNEKLIGYHLDEGKSQEKPDHLNDWQTYWWDIILSLKNEMITLTIEYNMYQDIVKQGPSKDPQGKRCQISIRHP
jgi:hypothetical protein